jgi:hypothetical protein
MVIWSAVIQHAIQMPPPCHLSVQNVPNGQIDKLLALPKKPIGIQAQVHKVVPIPGTVLPTAHPLLRDAPNPQGGRPRGSVRVASHLSRADVSRQRILLIPIGAWAFKQREKIEASREEGSHLGSPVEYESVMTSKSYWLLTRKYIESKTGLVRASAKRSIRYKTP